ncbi:MAG TPA: nucleotide sugar dehydrogenase [Candidatus Babeliales bacterium]|nr:nucleotide sugar dehydrogenase [Candidatus Babeliales bacterium]
MKPVLSVSLALMLLTSICVNAIDNITVIGIGCLGICNALCLEKVGFNVLGIDISPEYVHKINTKTLESCEPGVIDYLQKSKNFRASTSLDEGLKFSDVYFVVVATPTTPNDEAYDHSILNSLLEEINKRKVANKHIVICCTVFPGYIHSIAPILLKDCTNVSVSYNPEFIAQGNIIQGFENPDIVLIGEGSREAGDILESIHRKVCKNNPKICRMSAESAEITKLSINCFITTKIAFANMIGDIADKTPGANKYDVLNAIGNDSRIGTKCLKPGYGFGGPCFPRDNRALGSYSKKIGIDPFIPQATDESNKLHARTMAESMINSGDDAYVFEDVNYKDNCPVIILTESQKLAVAAEVAHRGRRVTIRDQEKVIAQVKKNYGNLFDYESI